MNAMKLAIPLFVALAYGPAQAVPILGSDLASFAVLGAETVTNVPTSTIFGSVGVAPGTALPGFIFVSGLATADSQVTGGLVHSNTAVANSAQAQLTTARTNLGNLGPGTLITSPGSVDLAGLTLTPGVYTVNAGVSNLTGTLTLDGQGDANAFWLFQMASTFITSPGSVVNVIGTGTGAGIFWNVGSSATIDTTTSFQGNILALTSIALNTNATIGCGRALADVGEVTLQKNTISIGCQGFGLEFVPGVGVVDTIDKTVVAAVPEPEIYAMMAVGLGLMGWVGRRKRLKEAAAA